MKYCHFRGHLEISKLPLVFWDRKLKLASCWVLPTIYDFQFRLEHTSRKINKIRAILEYISLLGKTGKTGILPALLKIKFT